MKKFVLASKNKHKAQEIKEILGSEYEIITMDEAGIGNLEIIEDGATFEENAAKKAAQVYNAVKLPTIADDSGLCVDYLNGAPGIYTARFAGENAADEDNINKLLSELDGIEHEKRTAKFVCVIAFIDGKTDKPQFFCGECCGYIWKEKWGEDGFGYDPVFYYPEFETTFAMLSPKQKNSVSHRFRALKSFADNLK